MKKYLSQEWKGVILLLFLVLASIGLQLTQPQLLGKFIDTAVNGGSLGDLTSISIGFLIVVVVLQVVSVSATYTGEVIGWKATNRLREDLVQQCLKLDPGFFKMHTTGEIIERVDGDVILLANFFTQFSLQVLGNGLLLGSVLLILYTINWPLGLIFSLYSIFVLGVLYRLRSLAVPFWNRARQASADLFGYLEERLAALEELRANGGKNYVLSGLYLMMRQLFVVWRKAVIIESFSISTISVISILAQVVGLALGTFLFFQDRISLGTIILINTYIGILDTPLSTLRDQWSDLQRARASIERIELLINVPILIQDGEAQFVHSQGGIEVQFDNVSFDYEPNGNVRTLNGISFRLPPGRSLGIIGRTGSGKTTIARLLLRLYDPQKGSIRLNGVDLRTFRLVDLRKEIGMVTQDVFLFQATLRDNLTWFDRHISDEQILKAIQDLGWWDWFSTLPEGLDTRLGAGGRGISAGESQLIALTRIFIRNPQLLILDEASALVDPYTEQLLNQAMDILLRGKTTIIIAHRMKSIGRVDDILLVENGSICEYGPRDQLLSMNTSRFSQLIQSNIEIIA